MELKNIKIDEETWWRLNEIKVVNRFKKISDVIRLLIKQYGKKRDLIKKRR